ncbi:uncharacterized protein SCHCODRAFT_02365073 [Schizophyllum commune H4-8]|uniref:uncharacterized protein n=1 Tax=Schizophyllum commune (strain H4-8 / FGSC 9210) TaxID=578458 RepID=UPI00215E3B81|nr:uncharacterized protein SCHCODRAFT_02365073 [Schizophyllum commune H4-8]KAI5889324.1 hypothetical protein SCHCODRAFT_02365073 [Schizophyllum commune H4-8]
MMVGIKTTSRGRTDSAMEVNMTQHAPAFPVTHEWTAQVRTTLIILPFTPSPYHVLTIVLPFVLAGE